MAYRISLAFASGWLSLCAVGCGGNADSQSGNSSCGTEACGGDIVGTWEVDGLCGMDISEEGFEGCPRATLTSDLVASGSAAFNSDGTATIEITISGTMTVTFPERCLTGNGVTLTCDEVERLLLESYGESEAAGEPASIDSVSCSGRNDCSCVHSLVPITSSSTGTFSVSGDRLTTTDDLGEVEDNGFCADGDTLIVFDISDEPGEEDAQIVLKRSR